jgi:hypothetical protein
MPAYVGVPYSASIGLNPGYFGGHMIGAHHNPFAPGGDPNAPNYTVQNLNLANGLNSINGLSSANGLMTSSAGRQTVQYLVKCGRVGQHSSSRARQVDANVQLLPAGHLLILVNSRSGGIGIAS